MPRRDVARKGLKHWCMKAACPYRPEFIFQGHARDQVTVTCSAHAGWGLERVQVGTYGKWDRMKVWKRPASQVDAQFLALAKEWQQFAFDVTRGAKGEEEW